MTVLECHEYGMCVTVRMVTPKGGELDELFQLFYQYFAGMTRHALHVGYRCVPLFLANTIAQYSESRGKREEKIQTNVHKFCLV